MDGAAGSPVQLWLDEQVAGVLASADAHLACLHRAPLHFVQDLVHPRVSDLAAVDTQKTMRPVLHEADVTVAADGKAKVVVISPGVSHYDHVPNRGDLVVPD